MKTLISLVTALALSPLAQAQLTTETPFRIPFQGRVSVDDQPFSGTGQFKFLLIACNPLTENPQTATVGNISRNNGAIDSVDVTNGGAGYVVAPIVTVTGGGGSGALLRANLDSGTITSITILDGGENYTSTPTITLSAPAPAETALWNNESSSPASLNQPTTSENLIVQNGVFHIALGDTNTAPLNASHLRSFNSTLKLRVWFSPTGFNFQQLQPDFTIHSSPFALVASTAQRLESLGSIASGANSIAMGFFTTASGRDSTAMGDRTIASGSNSTAMGLFTTASGDESTAMGNRTIASGSNSTAMGFSTTASGDQSTAMGNRTIASSIDSTAMGSQTTASGVHSTAMGSQTIARNFRSTAMGYLTIASGSSSTAMGHSTTAPSCAETSIGLFNTPYTPASTFSFNSSDRLFVIGNGAADDNRSDALIIQKNGESIFQADPGNISSVILDNYASRIINTDASNGADVLALKVNEANPDLDTNFLAFFAGDNANGGNILGEIDGNGSGGVVFRSSGADYAEYLPPLSPTETFAAGDVVAVRSGRITRDTSSFDQLMVISSNPIIVGNRPKDLPEDESGYYKVAFIGQVPIRVNGPVNSGDYLLASGKHNGTAIAKAAADLRASDRSRIIGRAWDSSKEAGEKLINAAVGLDQGEALVAEIRRLKQAYTGLEQRVKAIENQSSTVVRTAR